MDIKALQLTLRRYAAELAQLADQTGIVLDLAPGKTHVLIDWENVQPNDADVRALVPEATDLWLFHGPNQKNVASHHAAFGERATPVRIARTGKNALDFHLSFYIGYIAARDPQARFVVISNDKGYGPMLDHARELGFAAEQVGFQKAKARAPAKRIAAKKSAATRPVPAKKAPARKVVARKAAAKKAPAAKVAAARPPAKKAAAAPRPAASAKAPAGTKSFEQVLAMLKKRPVDRLPRKHARLLADVAQMIGVDADAREAHAMLDRLVASGKVSLDARRTVSYAL
jgi:hypothetical protein